MSNGKQLLKTQLIFVEGSEKSLVRMKKTTTWARLRIQKSFLLNLMKYKEINAMGIMKRCWTVMNWERKDLVVKT